MKIKNITKSTTLSENAFTASSFIDRSLGLLDPKKPRTLLLNTRFGIHTFGMKEAIDVIILDRESNVSTLKEALKPNRIFLWNPRYNTAIELPAGSIKRTKTTVRDEIVLGS